MLQLYLTWWNEHRIILQYTRRNVSDADYFNGAFMYTWDTRFEIETRVLTIGQSELQSVDCLSDRDVSLF